MAREVATYKQRRELEDLLLRSSKQEQRGAVLVLTLHPGRTLDGIAKEVDPILNKRHAEYIMDQMGWVLHDTKPRGSSATLAALSSRLDAMEATLLELVETFGTNTASIGELDGRLTALEMDEKIKLPMPFHAWADSINPASLPAPAMQFVSWFRVIDDGAFAPTSNAMMKRFINKHAKTKKEQHDRTAQGEIAWAEYVKYKGA